MILFTLTPFLAGLSHEFHTAVLQLPWANICVYGTAFSGQSGHSSLGVHHLLHHLANYSDPVGLIYFLVVILSYCIENFCFVLNEFISQRSILSLNDAGLPDSI